MFQALERHCLHKQWCTLWQEASALICSHAFWHRLRDKVFNMGAKNQGDQGPGTMVLEKRLYQLAFNMEKIHRAVVGVGT